MRQRQPHRAQPQHARGDGVENAARDVDVCDGIAVKQDRALHVEIAEEGQGNRRGQRGYVYGLVSAGGFVRWASEGGCVRHVAEG
jgi:hypothetical protein